MSGLYNFNQVEIMAFFMVLVRMSSFVVSWPIFGTQTLPAPVKILFALSLSMAMFPVIQLEHLTADLNTSHIIMIAIKEAFIGLSLGYLAKLFLYSISIAGEIISVSMGLSGAQLFNPSMGATSTALDQFQVFLVSLLFLAINGHHIFLSALSQSFELVPISRDLISLNFFSGMGDVVQQIMVVGVKLSAPVLVSVTMMNIMMAVVGRAVPQINVLVTSLPINILVGFFVLIFTLPVLLGQVEGLLNISAVNIFKMLKTF